MCDNEPVRKQRRITDLFLRHSEGAIATRDDDDDKATTSVDRNVVSRDDGDLSSEPIVQLPVPTIPSILATEASCSSRPCANVAYNETGLGVGKILNDEQRVKFVNPWKPSSVEEYPSSERRDENLVTKDGVQRRRRLLPHHLETFPWLAVSKFMEGALCIPCVLFTSNAGVGGRSQGHGQQTGILVRRPLTRFEDLTGKNGDLLGHQNTVYQQNAVIARFEVIADYLSNLRFRQRGTPF